MAGLTVLASLAAAILPSCLALPSSVQGRKILAGGQVITFKGVNWNPVPAGKTQSQGVDFRGYVEVDSALMASAGINVVRTYRPITDRDVLDALWRKRIQVLNTVFISDKHDVQSVVQPVTALKDHPAILMWCVGNEWNYNHLYSRSLLFDDAFARVNEVSKLLKQIDPTHLVATVYGMLPAVEQITGLPAVDVWGLTAYTGISFGSLFDMWEARATKPMFLAEFGADAYNAKAKVVDEAAQAQATTALMNEILGHSALQGGVCTGGLLFELADEWWKDSEGSPKRHDIGGIAPGGGPFPDHVFNEEFWGIVRIDGTPRQAFQAYAALPPAGLGAASIKEGFRMRACGASPGCTGRLGDCCPTPEGQLLTCCSSEAINASHRGSAAVMPATAAPTTTAPATTAPAATVIRNSTAPMTAAVTTTSPPTTTTLSTTATQTTTATQATLTTTERTAPTTVAPSGTIVAPSGTTVAPNATSCKLERGYIYVCPDFAKVKYVSSAEACATLCSSHPACRSFTHSKTTHKCFLKAAASPKRVANDCCDSGPPCAQDCLMERNYDYAGDNLASIGNIASAEACAALCARSQFCKSFTYAKRYGTARVCHLKKSTMPGRTASDCCDSGLPCKKAQPTPEAKTTAAPRPGTRLALELTPQHELVATISVGDPPQALRCLLDSSSADIWIPSKRCRGCGSRNAFHALDSKSFAPEVQRRPMAVRLSLGSGGLEGYPVRDTLELGPELRMPNQSFIIVEDSTLKPQRNWDGICGLGWRQLGRVHHPLYSRLQDEGRRALFALVPLSQSTGTLVIGEVPHASIRPGSLVWVNAEFFQPGTMSRWMQRSFWVATGGLQIHMPSPVSSRFLLDTGVSEALLAPPKHYSKFIRSLLPEDTLRTFCGMDLEGQVTCSCEVLAQKLVPLQIHLGGRAFAFPVKELFMRTGVGETQRCKLLIRPNPRASSKGSGMLEGLGELLRGLMTGILGRPREALEAVPSARPHWEQEDPQDELWVLGGMFVARVVTIFDFDKALLGFALPAVTGEVGLASQETVASASVRSWPLLVAFAIAAAAATAAALVGLRRRRRCDQRGAWVTLPLDMPPSSGGRSLLNA